MALKSMKMTLMVGATLAALGAGVTAFAAGGYDFDYKMEHRHWGFNGMRGAFDKAAMQRGYQVYREKCSSCHTLEHLAFRHLGDKDGPYYDEAFKNPNDNPFVKTFAADWLIADIDAETGDPIERPGIPADYFPPIYPNDAAARGSNGGALPPDLSVMVAARGGGADYVYNLLIAYGLEKPEGMKLSPGVHYNPVMEGGKIAMAAPLTEGLIDYADGTEATVEQMAADVTEFLAWSADPKLEQRKRAGFATMVYLLILTVLLWFSYKRVWRNVEH
ncbi:cytochrome c1 [Fretibacter rubidus]|uniref:cytochrome c1 n=1 Tax=Fretibacter rubidus TaxID=570162 RepID=UPI00352A8B61